MSGDIQIAGANGSAPQSYLVPNAQEIEPLAITAVFDGTLASGTFVPTVEIVSPGGIVIARVPASSVAAGGSAEVTFAPFLDSGAGSGGGTAAWALAGTGSQTGLASGAQTLSIFNLNTDAPAVYSVVNLGASTLFVDAQDAPTQQDRWGFNAFQIRHGQVDVSNAAAWTDGSVDSVASSLTVGSASELVYAFLSKVYISGLTSSAPFTTLYSDDLPALPFTAQYFAASASGQGAGAVAYAGSWPHAGGPAPNTEVIMVGVKPFGAAPSQISLTSAQYAGTNQANAPLPAALQLNDLVILHLAIRNGNGNPSIATPSGWTLLQASPSRGVDPHFGIIDQFVYAHTAGVSDQYVLQINETGVYVLASGVQADDAAATGQVETTMTVTAGGTFSTWDGGNYIIGQVGDGALNHWRANETKLLSVTSAPVQVTLHANNRTGSALATWEGGIFVQRLSEVISAATWDV